jgi:hypothetical protein
MNIFAYVHRYMSPAGAKQKNGKSTVMLQYTYRVLGQGRPFTWGISEALGVTLGGVPLYVPVLVPVLYI